MHPRVIADRAARARARITQATDALAAQLQLAPCCSIDPHEQRDPAVAQMRELEILADVLDATARALPAAMAPKKAHNGAH